MLWGYDDLASAVKQGFIDISPPDKIGPISIDVHIGHLFRRKEIKALMVDELNLSQEDFINDLLEEVPGFDGGVELRPGEFYLGLTEEEIFLGQGLAGEITSRSGYARLGVMVRSLGVDQYLGELSSQVRSKALIMIKPYTNVLLKKGEPAAQLFVFDYNHPVLNHELALLLRSSEFIIKRGDANLSPKDIPLVGGLNMSMAAEILLYNNQLIIPGSNVESCFEKISLMMTDPLFLGKDSFFISSSEEYIEIPDGYAGYVTSRNSIMVNTMFMKTLDPLYSPFPFFSHVHAPYISPRTVFKGSVTFENLMMEDSFISPGMKEAELFLYRLKSPLKSHAKSRYYGQNGPELFKNSSE